MFYRMDDRDYHRRSGPPPPSHHPREQRGGFDGPRPPWGGDGDERDEHWGPPHLHGPPGHMGPRGPPPRGRPPPPWARGGPPPGVGGPRMMGPRPDFDDAALIPKVPYYELPAGLMAPLVKVTYNRPYITVNCSRTLQVLKTAIG